MVYTIQERISIVAAYFENGRCVRATARSFNEIHPEKTTSYQYVIQLMNKFLESGSVLNKKHEREKPMRNEGVAVAVVGHAVMDNIQSLRQLETISGVSKSSVHRILKEAKFHPYKMQNVQELNEDDPDRRTEFCEIMSQLLIGDNNYLYNVCFSDESSFYLNGHVNRHNCRYWSDVNPHWYSETHSQIPQKLNVCAGILGDHIVGPYFIDGNLNGQKYLDLLDTTVNFRITELLENDDGLLEGQLTFQQDGAPPHFVAPVRQFLDDNFTGRWIGRRGPIEWPARSPDLSPLDFFLWGHLKSKVYITQPNSLG